MLQRSNIYRSNLFLLKFISILLLAITVFTVTNTKKAAATYDGSRLIDNGVFLDANTMTKEDIQSFLLGQNSGLASRNYVLNCYASDSKERQWYTAVGAPCDQTIPASHIIYYASQIYGVNPRVVLATLQKEQSLITSPNPTSWQISQAMGYACPTSGSCSSESNFFYQIDSGVWVLRYHYERANGNMEWWRPSTSWVCGTPKNLYSTGLYPGNSVTFIDTDGVPYRTFTIANAATAAFYCYTPHTYNNHPNGAANSDYPTGTRCYPYTSHFEYGNTGRCYTGSYNFVRSFEQWFGTTQRKNGEIVITGAVNISDNTPKVGQQVLLSYSVSNTSTYTVDSGVLWICGEMNGKAFGGGSKRKILAPGESLTMTMNYTPFSTGTMAVRACGDVPNSSGFSPGYPYATYADHGFRTYSVGTNPISISSGINLSRLNPLAGETVDISYKVKNNDLINFDSGQLWICGEMNGKAFGGGSKRKILAPGEELLVTLPYTIKEKGTLAVAACGNLPNGPGFVVGYPKGPTKDYGWKSFTINTDAIKIVGAMNIKDLQPNINVPTTIAYAVKNYASSSVDSGVLWICGEINGKSFAGGTQRKVLLPGEILTISMNYTPTQTGILWVAACGNPPNGPGFVAGYPFRSSIDHGLRNYQVIQ